MSVLTSFTFNLIRILVISSLTVFFSLVIAPSLVKVLNKLKFWKKEARKKTITGEEATVFYSLHNKREVSVPRGGGVLIWLSAIIIISFFYYLSSFTHPWWLKEFNFLSRGQTWLPIFTLIVASLVGLVDDALTIFGKGKYVGGGMSFWRRLVIVALIGLIGGLWFYYKLDWNTIYVPFLNFPRGGEVFIGFWYVPLFVLVMLASWSGGVIDGLDGLSGGIFASIFGAFSIIAFSQGKTDLATFCAVITGALFAFLWYNIPPAKFYMGETGILGLTSTMAVVAFLTDSVLVLPIIAGIMVIEVGSIILQLLSKRFRHKKIWLSTPIHHHFEARGWPAYQVTMRLWIISVVFATLGVALRLLG